MAGASQQAVAPNIVELVERQRRFFRSGATRRASFRRARLADLSRALVNYEERFLEALSRDLGKSRFEAYASEIGIVYEEINFARKRLNKWMKVKGVPTPLVAWPGRSEVRPEPYGVALVLSPWNYPVQLAIAPVVAAIAAGNTIILKPSELTPATSQVLFDMVTEHFDADFFQIVQGDAAEAQALIEAGPNYLFFTGSTAVGKKVMSAASAELIPLTLELGGKSPTFVCDDADLAIAARRIMWGKFLNAGQTCVAPDYLLVHRDVADPFVAECHTALREFFGDDPKESPDYGRIVNDNHFQRLSALIEGTVIAGGDRDGESRYLSPTMLDLGSLSSDSVRNHPAMKEEIFGPILPLIRYENLDKAVEFVNAGPQPLAAYFFTRSRSTARALIEAIPFGGGCVNDTVIHLTSPHLPFGGVGSSGMGSYHGKAGFDTFSHYKSLLYKAGRPDVPIKYPPYKGKLGLLKRLLKP